MKEFIFEPQTFILYNQRYDSWIRYITIKPIHAQVAMVQLDGSIALAIQEIPNTLFTTNFISPLDELSYLEFSWAVKHVISEQLQDSDKGFDFLLWEKTNGPEDVHQIYEFSKFSVNDSHLFRYDSKNAEVLHYKKTGNLEVGQLGEGTALVRVLISQTFLYFIQIDYDCPQIASSLRLRDVGEAIEHFSEEANTNNPDVIVRMFGPTNFMNP